MTASCDKNIIAITGANGFIGKHLVNSLSSCENTSIRILVRKLSKTDSLPSNVIQVQGDLNKPETLEGFLVPGCTVVNLAYSFSATHDQNITATRNLIAICRATRIKRFIHCSTAAVFGRAKTNVVDEGSECNPRTEYGKSKLLIEDIVLTGSSGIYECVNMRPTAVYGPGGQALMKLINNLAHGNNILNYLRSCLFNSRYLNLVHVLNVVEAIIFLIDADKRVDGETYIVSEDFEPFNNYKYVENFFIERLTRRHYLIPPIPIPHVVLSFLLRLRERESVKPKMIYCADKLREVGFQYKIPLKQGLDDLVEQYKRDDYLRRDGDI